MCFVLELMRRFYVCKLDCYRCYSMFYVFLCFLDIEIVKHFCIFNLRDWGHLRLMSLQF